MPIRPLLVITSGAIAALALTGCVPNAPVGGATAIAVAITDDTCDVSTATATAGNVTCELTNTGSDVNEFEILAEDQLRIVGEKENVVPGATTTYTAHLQPGTYYTACKFQMVGAPIGLAEFTVTGEATVADADEQQLIDGAVADYVAYVKSQAGELIPAVAAFSAAYAAGDDETARSLFASTRVFYERIEPTAEAFGDLDPKIDYREVDAVAEGLDWTGFHRMEKDLWPPAEGDLNSDGTSALLDWAPSTPDERAAFAAAYAAGDDETARSLFASTRVSYERIEPTAEAFGDLDPKIDYREVDAVAEGLDWTGFHRIEKDLWPPAEGDVNSDDTSAFLDWAPSTAEQRQAFADGLVTDVQQLADLVNASDFTVSLADISNGAIGLLDEVAVGKISGEEDWWSHTDLWDFAANVEGAKVAFGNVKEIARSKGDAGTALVNDIETEFANLEALLAQYGSYETGFTSYDEVTEAQRKELSDAVNALGTPLSNLTHTVLGVDG